MAEQLDTMPLFPKLPTHSLEIRPGADSTECRGYFISPVLRLLPHLDWFSILVMIAINMVITNNNHATSEAELSVRLKAGLFHLRKNS